MTAVDGRVLRGERNREAIADALIACYDDGILRPSAAEVARRAGVSARSVHNHFADMETLRAEVAQRQWVRVAALAGGTPDGAAELVGQRARLFEMVTPVRRAALLSVHNSPTIAAYLGRLDRTLRRQVGGVFPSLSGDLLDAVDALLSWDTWNRLRTAQGCSVARAERVLVTTLESLLSNGSKP